ncbi:outer membrane protein PmpF [Chlamydia suis]|uniref:Outer membrane protein PmpF n=1 Tax=Chlamydia suis TaxID=83559 RepID=A0ABX6IT97_9CHLA|nr:outer membrane protein PmpF [Chlamydia suis]
MSDFVKRGFNSSASRRKSRLLMFIYNFSMKQSNLFYLSSIV